MADDGTGAEDRADDHVEDEAGVDRVADEAQDASAGCRGLGGLHGEGRAEVAGHEQYEHGDTGDDAERVLFGQLVGNFQGELPALCLGGFLVQGRQLRRGDQARGLGDHHSALRDEAAVDLRWTAVVSGEVPVTPHGRFRAMTACCAET
ncbi:hypothetical protein [Streptomyces lavendulae]|uniref:hypothetical protein n=1 Tax=Streptomyces lavendulae TaxID=1914 RepID=UPI0004BFA88F|nr:hypothetical protein [Streptomyces lavendulae]